MKTLLKTIELVHHRAIHLKELHQQSLDLLSSTLNHPTKGEVRNLRGLDQNKIEGKGVRMTLFKRSWLHPPLPAKNRDNPKKSKIPLSSILNYLILNWIHPIPPYTPQGRGNLWVT